MSRLRLRGNAALALVCASHLALAQTAPAPVPPPATNTRPIPPPPAPPSAPAPPAATPAPAAAPTPSPGAPSAPVAAPAPATMAPASIPSLGENLTGAAKADDDAARSLYGVGDYASALVKFRSAYETSKDPRLLWNIAACEKSLHHYARVAEIVPRYLEEGKGVLSETQVQSARDLLSTLPQLTGKLTISADQPGATVFVDDDNEGVTPLAKPVLVDLGLRRVRVVKDGFHEFASSLNVQGASESTIVAVLKPIVHEGRIFVHAGGDDAITIDGTPMGTTTWEGTVGSGGHTVRVTAKGKKPYQNQVVVNDGQVSTVDVALEPEAHGGIPAWIWVTGGVLLAGGIAAGTYVALKPGTTTASPPPGTMGSATLSFR